MKRARPGGEEVNEQQQRLSQPTAPTTTNLLIDVLPRELREEYFYRCLTARTLGRLARCCHALAKELTNRATGLLGIPDAWKRPIIEHRGILDDAFNRYPIADHFLAFVRAVLRPPPPAPPSPLLTLGDFVSIDFSVTRGILMTDRCQNTCDIWYPPGTDYMVVYSEGEGKRVSWSCPKEGGWFSRGQYSLPLLLDAVHCAAAREGGPEALTLGLPADLCHEMQEARRQWESARAVLLADDFSESFQRKRDEYKQAFIKVKRLEGLLQSAYDDINSRV